MSPPDRPIQPMTADRIDTTLRISGLTELSAGNASDFKALARSEFQKGLTQIDLDCCQLSFIDSSGLGALISLQKLAAERDGRLRLLSPRPAVLQILELTRLHRTFEMVS